MTFLLPDLLFFMNSVCPKCKKDLRLYTRKELVKCSLKYWVSDWKKED